MTNFLWLMLGVIVLSYLIVKWLARNPNPQWEDADFCPHCMCEISGECFGESVCPHCGVKDDYTFKYVTEVRRWVKSDPWWYWGNRGYWIYREEDR